MKKWRKRLSAKKKLLNGGALKREENAEKLYIRRRESRNSENVENCTNISSNTKSKPQKANEENKEKPL